MLVSEAFKRYVEDRIIFANKSPKTEEAYLYASKSLVSYTTDIPLEELTFIHIRQWVDSLKKRSLSSGTIRGYVVCLRAVLGYMQILKIPCLNPELILVPERVDPTPLFITPEEVTKLIETVNQTPNCSKLTKARNKAVIALLYSSLIRVSELCSLNKEDVYGEVFTVLGKGGKRRPCMVDKRARRLLDEYLALRTDSQPALFVDGFQNLRMRPGTIQSLFRRLSKRFGKPVHPHTLRHSGANDLMRNGCHIYPLSRIMGHSSIATTQTYFQMYDPELLEVHKKYHRF
jgi:integrase/recombinase XerC